MLLLAISVRTHIKTDVNSNRNENFVKITPFEPAHEIVVLITYATSEGSGEPAYPRSLARAFAVRIRELWK